LVVSQVRDNGYFVWECDQQANLAFATPNRKDERAIAVLLGFRKLDANISRPLPMRSKHLGGPTPQPFLRWIAQVFEFL
jgi:hypothetical protein